MKKKSIFGSTEMTSFEPDAKVGLLATVNPHGFPHITLITSIQAKTPTQLIWGQFSEGLSKENVKGNPRTGFLILTMDRRMCRGKALWTHEEKEGENYEMFNRKPMFRYNAYFGIHTVHCMDLIETGGMESLPLIQIIVSSVLTGAARVIHKTEKESEILKPWAQKLINSLSSLKFISYISDDGYPVIIPLIQCQAADSRQLVFSTLAYGAELRHIPNDATVAVFALNLDMENVLIRGTFSALKKYGSIPIGKIDIRFVYNSMPPKQGQIYPTEPIAPLFQ
jgi:hypothetical protein